MTSGNHGVTINPKLRRIILIMAGVVLVTALSATAATGYKRFGDGVHRVSASDVPPGTYRAPGGDGCYWERLKSFSGDFNAILANENAQGPTIVTILPTDKGFNSHDCGTWTSNLSSITKSKTRFGEGTYIVGTDITPGTYRSRGGEGCYWQRLSSFSGSFNSIIANANPTGSAIVTISRSDKGFESHSCGTWSRF